MDDVHRGELSDAAKHFITNIVLADRSHQPLERARWIARARNVGATFADIAAELGVTSQRVEQMSRVAVDPEYLELDT
jgi:DNA-directed RNA polymerase sigma subunit (sigma70/sigma32)